MAEDESHPFVVTGFHTVEIAEHDVVAVRLPFLSRSDPDGPSRDGRTYLLPSRLALRLAIGILGSLEKIESARGDERRH